MMKAESLLVIHLHPLENTEWEVVKLTGTIAHMSPDIISKLSQIYLAQKLYGEHWIEFTKQFASGNGRYSK